MNLIANPMKKRGRPPTDPVDRLRTEIWFVAVKLRSRLPSAYAIERSLDGDRFRTSDDGVVRPRKWDRYRDGNVVPDYRSGPRSAIDQAERIAPGSARVFRSALWRVLKREAMSKSEIIAELRKLPTANHVLFEHKPRTGETHPRIRDFDDVVADELSALDGFEAIEALVLLSTLAGAIGSTPLRNGVSRLYRNMLRPMSNSNDLCAHFGRLFSLTDAHCSAWSHVSATERLNIVFPWTGNLTDADLAQRSEEHPLAGATGKMNS